MPAHIQNIQKSLANLLKKEALEEEVVTGVMNSGYFLRSWADPFSGKTWQTISDFMYGNKQLSSSFEIDEFIACLRGQHEFEPLAPFRRYRVKNYADIEQILTDQSRQHYQEEGSLVFRGQPKEYVFQRSIPNPRRANQNGGEISVIPGLYRQNGEKYSFDQPVKEERSFDPLLAYLEPNNPNVHLDSSLSFDIMRAEQHYASQTSGLDVAFDIETALFFATYRFINTSKQLADYEKIPTGQHSGVIYCFRFRDPPVKRTEYLIRKFDLFKTFPPARILKQNCGLPLIGPHERNIATTDIDCIIELDKAFDYDGRRTPEEMFPDVSRDRFYGRLLDIKDRHADLLSNVVEYKWAR